MEPKTTADLLNFFREQQRARTEYTPTEYRYVLYVRKSTEGDEKQKRSLDDQELECKAFAARMGIRIVEELREAMSAKEPDTRPKFRKMLENLKAGKYDGIIAWHPDRLARNMKEAGEVIDLLDKRIIKDLKFPSFTFVNDTSGKMNLGINFVLSKQYSDQLSDNVSRGNQRSVEEGRYINRPIHGYYKDPNQRLRPDDDNFLLIKNAFQMRLNGKTLDDIAKYLNESGYRRIGKIAKMDKQKIDKMLRNPAYAGVLRYGKSAVDLTQQYDFEPIISVEEFIQIINISRSRGSEELIKLARRFRKPDTVQANLMLGRVFCAVCGKPRHAGLTSKEGKDGVRHYFYYRCETRDCKQRAKSVRAKVILEDAYAFLDTKPFSSRQAYEHYEKELKRVSEAEVREARAALKSLYAQQRAEEGDLRNLRLALAGEQNEALKRGFREDIAATEGRIADIGEKITAQERIAEHGKASVLSYAEFLELMDSMAQTLRSIKNLEELDFLLGKIFANFTVDGKKVVNRTLCEPFASLQQLKGSSGAPGGTRTHSRTNISRLL